MKRRDFFKIGAISALLTGRKAAVAVSRASEVASSSAASARLRRALPFGTQQRADRRYDADYIVVGSGAGGGTVAARLVEAGSTVLLLEAGGDPREAPGVAPESRVSDPLLPVLERPREIPAGKYVYDIPAFHTLATVHDWLAWQFFVGHYGDPAQQRRDAKFVNANDPARRGLFYPRAGTLGGCTAHNALMFVYPHNSDWDMIADITGDPSWRADQMRTYFERVENCRHRPLERWLTRFRRSRSRHGWAGWLDVERANIDFSSSDGRSAVPLVIGAVRAAQELGIPTRTGDLDPNDWRFVSENGAGVRYTPLTTRNHVRVGTRERLLDVRRRFPERLNIVTDALATRVLFEGNRAVGVEYLKGERLYRASVARNAIDGEPHSAYAAREVIVAGGAFNTPQLLMLSGIGPRATLQQWDIPVLVDLPVGKNLQDHYEIDVRSRMTDVPAFQEPNRATFWKPLAGATFTPNDEQYRQWNQSKSRRGVYTSNGVLLSVIARSTPAKLVPDLFCYALTTDFSGYFPGYEKILDNLNYFTWVVLKGHTNNTAGEVTLRSRDPRDPPIVNFNYFEEGSAGWQDDLQAVVDGIKLVRRLNAEVFKQPGYGAVEERPGPEMQSDDQLRSYVRDNAWGHHASCTCPIGPRERGGVLSTDFKVHGTRNLRVVDASAFPRTPGLFIVSAVYMIGEKAADVIIAEGRANG